MEVPKEVLERVMWGIIDNFLVPKFIELGMDASGDWIASLTVRTSSNGASIWGAKYTEQLQNGRRPGTYVPIAPLQRWAEIKLGLNPTEARSAAFAISKKIQKEGTKYYPNGTDLVNVLHSEQVKEYIRKELKTYFSGAVKNRLVEMFKKIK